MAEKPTFGITFDASGAAEGFGHAATAFSENFEKPVAQSADVLSAAFRRVFVDLERAFTGTAKTGELSMKQMVNAILNDLSRLGFRKFVEQPLTKLIDGIFGDLLDFGGARATGGPVSAGAPYLVGERGPEMFVPAGAGQIVPRGAPRGGAPVVHFHITTPDAESFRRSEVQVAAMLARAVKRGTRGL